VHANLSALLLGARSDYLFHFSYNDIAFYCRPAAVTTIDQLLLTPKLPKVCKEQAHNFLRKHPYANKQYAYKLHEEQKYYLLGLKQDCFIMLNGGVSFSEHLLEKGFAKLQNNLDDAFLTSTMYKKLKRAEQRAEYHKRGIWEDPILANCF
jgi:endonuclease YncB( thermonuclease family)